MNHMTNEACLGYMILAAKAHKFSHVDISWLIDEMKIQMDEKTEEEAEQVYKSN